MTTEYQEKIRSIAVPRKWGSSTRKPVEGEHQPVAGFHTEHWDDRQDATVFPEAISLSLAPKEE